MSISTYIVAAVRPTRKSPEMGCRVGTVEGLTLADMRRIFGEPNEVGSGDDKVTASWYFSTPRGVATVRDYWWNAKDELSISGTPAQALWVAAFFRRIGADAHLGMRRRALLRG